MQLGFGIIIGLFFIPMILLSIQPNHKKDNDGVQNPDKTRADSLESNVIYEDTALIRAIQIRRSKETF